MKWFSFAWRIPGGLKECPYFHLSMIKFFGYSIRIHEWHADDDLRHMHDHPTWFWTLVLKGGYTDRSESGDDVMRPGSLRFRPAEYKHSVADVVPGTITLLLFGRPQRRWGFWVSEKLIKRDKYFAEHGHHPCDHGHVPVRIRPDGSRI